MHQPCLILPQPADPLPGGTSQARCDAEGVLGEEGAHLVLHFELGIEVVEPLDLEDRLLHGTWTWYRRDDTMLRTGQFRVGDEVGIWTTYAADGTPVRTTRR